MTPADFLLASLAAKRELLFSIDTLGTLVVDNKASTGSTSGSAKSLISIPAKQVGDVAMYFDNVAYGYVNK